MTLTVDKEAEALYSRLDANRRSTDTLVAGYPYYPHSPSGFRLRRGAARRDGGADALGRRTAKIVNDGQGNWTRTDFYYDAQGSVIEEDAAQATGGGAYASLASAPATVVSAQYVYGVGYIDTPICRFRNADQSTDGSTEEALYYTSDANHNVTALVRPDGTVVERYIYDAYGRPHVVNGDATVDPDGSVGQGMADWTLDPDNKSDVANTILFASYSMDTETGLMLAGYRYYHSTLGRWITKDPAGFVDGMNVTQYCGSNPTNATDPSGLELRLQISELKTLSKFTDHAALNPVGDAPWYRITLDDFGRQKLAAYPGDPAYKAFLQNAIDSKSVVYRGFRDLNAAFSRTGGAYPLPQSPGGENKPSGSAGGWVQRGNRGLVHLGSSNQLIAYAGGYPISPRIMTAEEFARAYAGAAATMGAGLLVLYTVGELAAAAPAIAGAIETAYGWVVSTAIPAVVGAASAAGSWVVNTAGPAISGAIGAAYGWTVTTGIPAVTGALQSAYSWALTTPMGVFVYSQGSQFMVGYASAYSPGMPRPSGPAAQLGWVVGALMKPIVGN